MVNVVCGLIAYTYQEKKPNITGINYEDVKKLGASVI